MTTVVRVLLLVAGLLALYLARGNRRHRPIAALLVGTVALDTTADVCRLPPELDLARHLVLYALSTWCALRVLSHAPRSFCAAIALIVAGIPFAGALCAPGAWERAATVTAILSCGVQASALLAWCSSRQRLDSPALCVGVLCAGDLVALLGPVGLGDAGSWWIATAQGAVVATGLMLLQVAAIAGERSRRVSLRAAGRAGLPELYRFGARRGLDS